MAHTRLLDEINRLFDEMVRDPWARPLPAPGKIKRPDATHLEVEMPLGGRQRRDVFVAVEGHRVTVTLRRRSSQTRFGSGAAVTTGEQEFPLSLSASLSFEQSYSGIEGDRASWSRRRTWSISRPAATSSRRWTRGASIIYPVRRLDEAIEILTSVKAGGLTEEGTVHYRANQHLKQLAERLRRFGAAPAPSGASE